MIMTEVAATATAKDAVKITIKDTMAVAEDKYKDVRSTTWRR